ASIAPAQRLVDAAGADYLSDNRERSASDAIVTLRGSTLPVLEEEMQRGRDRHGCTAAAEDVRLAMRRMVRQILHEPTVRARQAAAEGNLEQYEAALQTIFGLEVTPNAQHDNKSSYSPARPEQLDSTNRRSA